MVNINDVTVTSLETITAFDPVTGDYMWTLDELQNATISNTQETVDVTGKNGRLLNTLKRNKEVTISGSNGLLSGGLMETQTGGTFESIVTEVMYPDYLEVNSNTATTSYVATGTTGNEISQVVVHNTDGTIGATYTQGDATAEGVFTYDPDTKTITFADGELEDGTEIAVYYFRSIRAGVLENWSDTYSQKATLYLDAFAEDKCANVYRVQFYFPLADFSGDFDIEFSDSQSAHNFEARSLVSGCKLSSKAHLWTYTIYGEDTEDYVESTDTTTEDTTDETESG